MNPITLSIDVTLLDKSRFKEVIRKGSGKKALFCDLILIPTPGGQYGDYMVKESQSKEERESGKQLPILGNGRNLERRSVPTEQPHDTGPDKDDTDSVPF